MSTKFVARLSAATLAVTPQSIRVGDAAVGSTHVSPQVRAVSQSFTSLHFPNLLAEHFGNAISGLMSFSTCVSVDEEWSGKDAKNYSQLSIKEALGTISASELFSLEKLQVKRRNKLDQTSGEVLVARYRQAKLDRELLEVITRNVSVKQRS